MKKKKGAGPTRVVIIGAGPAGLAVAHGLSATSALRKQYQVTVYQAGWRAGGKITSGRQGTEHRMRQNGTHYLFGCYFNTFELARQAYSELNMGDENDFGTFDDAFIPLSFLVLKHHFQGKWHDWEIEIPTNRHVPGDHTSLPHPTTAISMLLQWMVEVVGGWKLLRRFSPEPPFTEGYQESGWLHKFLAGLVDATVVDLLALARWILKHSVGSKDALDAVAWLLNEVRRACWGIFGSRVDKDLTSCQRWMLVDLGCSLITGLIKDNALEPGGLAALDQYDFRTWLKRHGASELTLQSPLVKGWYDSIASYEDGDGDKPNVSAGATIYALLWATLGYKGAFAYSAKRELGETWVAPMFGALRKRGVQFKFFHRIWNVKAKKGEISRLKIEAQLPGVDTDNYDPFITVKGRKAWPDHPLYERLDLDDLEQTTTSGGDLRDADLEDFYTSWRGQKYNLEKGRDFDIVVFAAPVGAIPFYCKQLVKEQPSWQDMVEHIRGVDTRSLWMYFKPNLAGLGWNYPSPLLTGYAKPFSTWEETTYLVNCETWPEQQTPGTICSLFGPMPGPPTAPGPNSPGKYPARQHKRANKSALRFARKQIGGLWPGVSNPDNPNGVDWAKLIDLEDRKGKARFDFQSVRANFGPIQRYTLARAGTLRYRLAPDESGYRNLFLAGDWTRNGTLVGCVEGAVKSGLMAAIAISGEGSYIGEDSKTGL